MSALERNPDVAASVPVEELGPGIDWRGILRGHSQLVWRVDFSEATEQVTEVLMITREEPCFLLHLEKNQEIDPQREMRPFSAAASREKPQLPT